MKRWIGFAALALATYLISLIVALPAANAYQWFLARPQLRAYGISGTLWNGHADAVIRGGQRLEDISWSFHPGALLSANLGYATEADLPDGHFSGDARIGPSGRIALSDAKLSTALGPLIQSLGSRPLPIKFQGRVEAILKHLTVKNGHVESADGAIAINDVQIQTGQGLSLGSFGIRVSDGKDGIDGKIMDRDGPLQVAGTVTMKKDGAVDLRVNVKTKPSAGDDLKKALGFIGLRQPDRGGMIQITGNLNQAGSFRSSLRQL